MAAEVTPDNARARCATCGTELGMAAAVRAADKTREARALLERWSANRVLDPFGPVAATRAVAGDSTPADKAMPRVVPAIDSAAAQPAAAAEPSPDSASAAREAAAAVQPAASREHIASEPSRRFRIDNPQSATGMHPQPAAASEAELEPAESPYPAAEPARYSRAMYSDEDHSRQSLLNDEFEAAPPSRRGRRTAWTSHRIDVQSAIDGGRRTNWFQLAGHLLAYAGALILTVGMALVLVGCFGGPAKVHFTPTGWLIATFGQLLLVSGAITLVSSGMERTSREVSQQIEALGDKLLRIDASGHRAPPRPLGSAAASRRRSRTARV